MPDSIITAMCAGLFPLFGVVISLVWNAFNTRQNQHLQTRLDRELARGTHYDRAQMDALVDIIGPLAETQARVKRAPTQFLPSVRSMPHEDLEELLAQMDLPPAAKVTILEAEGEERTKAYRQYAMPRLYEETWQSIRATHALVESKAALLPEPVVSALRSHIDLMNWIMSDLEDRRSGVQMANNARAEYAANLKNLDPSYERTVGLIRQALSRGAVSSS